MNTDKRDLKKYRRLSVFIPANVVLKMELNGKQLKLLRSRGHSLSPVASIGKAGLSIAQVENIRRLLETHELIKIRLPETGRKEIAQQLAAASGSQCVEILGRTGLLYQPKPEA